MYFVSGINLVHPHEIKGGEGFRGAMEKAAVTAAGEVVILLLQGPWPGLQKAMFLSRARSLSLKEEISWLRNCFSEKSQHPPV